MTHSKRCPYCKTLVSSGHGDPFKHLGSPIKICNYCKNEYIDNDIIDWEISPFYRKVSYTFSNNRIWICLLPPIILGGLFESLFLPIISFAVLYAFCLFYVYIQVKDSIKLSKKRSEDLKYVQRLIDAKYPIKSKLKKQ